MATIVKTEHRQRGVFGWICKILFIGFNLAIAAWVAATVYAFVEGGHSMNELQPGLAPAVGVIEFSVIFLIWAFGAGVLGALTYLTRGKKVAVEARR
jgi:hypothetical protein